MSSLAGTRMSVPVVEGALHRARPGALPLPTVPVGEFAVSETLVLPAGADEYSGWLPRRGRSAGMARRLLRDFLADQLDGELFVEAGELVVSELVTNAVRHARTPPGRLLLVRFVLRAERLRIEVHDASSGRPAPRAVGLGDESGRGLWLVKQLSLAWGCCPRAGGIGKACWALIGPSGVSAQGARAN